MSPLSDVAQPAIPTSDTITRMPGVRRANRRYCGKTPRLGGLDLNKKAGARILFLHNSERLLGPLCLRSLVFGEAVAVVMPLATARPAVTDNAPVRAARSIAGLTQCEDRGMKPQGAAIRNNLIRRCAIAAFAAIDAWQGAVIRPFQRHAGAAKAGRRRR
ncbi:hypothetical protein ACQCP0_09290 [Ralstonia pseudosolanacearum]|uniref:Uncharacterized protein n=1 Tax=Ralstonia solanacearum TaxID=305 RepID=A0ABY6NHP5_RALSL|nr:MULTISPECIES: hypothetical protein [Ralstonia]USS51200.1 hypothetical protein NHF34_16340 [Ralstonia solanacearum]MDK1382114.1 hypothetical protein [Ralstonia pseudosolanacearum]UNJ31517.1 hypothetical protein MNY32_03575 [Ralstonia pseudosolanacearum]UZF16717.1 hypothetical protein LH706_04085 [Ralstonia solanacearum]UZF26857.1 hypothetical protein LGV80_04030 [Ralstonia sp. RS642]